MAHRFFILFFMEAASMREITLQLDAAVILFYSRIASASGQTLEQVLSDALFKLAGELSLQALQKEYTGK